MFQTWGFGSKAVWELKAQGAGPDVLKHLKHPMFRAWGSSLTLQHLSSGFNISGLGLRGLVSIGFYTKMAVHRHVDVKVHVERFLMAFRPARG